MATTQGELDPQGSPLVKVAIFPEGRPDSAKEFDAIIDTGFTAFAQMPMTAARELGLRATGTMDITYGDGTTRTVPVTWASVRLGADTREGFVHLSEDYADVLVGVHFLREFRLRLVLSVVEGRVELEVNPSS